MYPLTCITVKILNGVNGITVVPVLCTALSAVISSIITGMEVIVTCHDHIPFGRVAANKSHDK